MISLTILPEWQDLLQQVGLADFESLMAFSGGKCLSEHPRGKTNIFSLPNGQTIFVKQDYYTKIGTTIRFLLRGKRPLSNTAKEIQNNRLAESHGFRVAKTILWGEERILGIPRRAVMIMLPVPGKPLDKFVTECTDPEQAKQAIKNAEAILTKLQDNALDWKIDCKPEHFFIADDLSVSLIDLERLHKRSTPLSTSYRQMQFDRFHSLLPNLSSTSK